MKFRYWFLCYFLMLILIFTTSYFASQKSPQFPIYQEDLAFQTDLAMMYLTALVTGFPRRDYLHNGRLEAATWLASEFRASGLEVYTQEFSVEIAGKKVTDLRNVYAVLPGVQSKAVLVVGHYDIPPFVRQGAADNGSGVATILELARIFASGPTPQWTMIFMTSDCQEYGPMYGSSHFLKESGWKEHLAAVISLDFANLGEMKGIEIEMSGWQQNYTPLWLRQIALASITPETEAIDANPFREWVDRALAITTAEHGIYLHSRIPALNLKGVPKHSNWQARYHHTTGDTIGKILPKTIDHYGRAAERLLRSLQLLEEFPPTEMSYLKVGAYYLPAWAIRLIQLLFLTPLLIRTLSAWRRTERDYLREVGRELRYLLASVLAGALGYFILRLLMEKGLFFNNELFPVLQKKPLLGYQQIIPSLVVLATAIIGYICFLRLLALPREVRVEIRQATSFTLMLLLIIMTIFLNAGFTSLAFLLPSILSWPLLSPNRSLWRRGINLLIALSGLIPIILLIYPPSAYIDANLGWQFIIAIAYGHYPHCAILLSLVFIAIFFRFIPSVLLKATPPSLTWGNKKEYFSWKNVLHK